MISEADLARTAAVTVVLGWNQSKQRDRFCHEGEQSIMIFMNVLAFRKPVPSRKGTK
jgi:hypothetical protein